MIKWYWYKFCPRCGEEGELTISRRVDTNELQFRCAECSWACAEPDMLDDFSSGYEGVDMEWEPATREEIARAGWRQYAVHEMLDHPHRP